MQGQCFYCLRTVDDRLELRRTWFPEGGYEDWGTMCDECRAIRQNEGHHIHHCAFCAGPAWKPFALQPMEPVAWGLCSDCYEGVFTIREPQH